MKKFKLAIFSLAMILLVFTSCTNNEPVVDNQQNTQESESIITALNQLSVQFDQNGNLTEDDNPAGNVVFDFCFDFVYPLDLSYNNGTTVTVDDLDGLISIMLASTNELYINGIAFPFEVETYNDETNAIEVVTINNEEEFEDLIENCDFDDFETCECFEVYDPVCVEISDPNGETFTVTYPNACYAECDGFTEDDFVDSCEEDYYTGGTECFTINYPLSITVNNETITVNSEEELGTALYDVYDFDFVYPFTVILENEEVVTINSPEDIEAILIDCYGEYNGDDCEECANEPVGDPVCIEYIDDEGNTTLTVFANMCFAECAGFTENDVVDCGANPSGCSEQAIEAVFLACQTWEATVGNQVYDYYFNPNGIVEIFNGNSDLVASGTWDITIDGGSNSVVMIISTNSDNFTDVWFYINCDPSGSFEIITNGGGTTDIQSSCD